VWKTIGQGFLVGISNPKTIVFFVAAVPPFVDYHAGSAPRQMIVPGLVFLTLAFVCDASWALLAGAARSWFASNPTRMSRLRATGGGMMIALGGTLAITGNTS
jgi:threonine/homoserine/homoserine lactone efflux protein